MQRRHFLQTAFASTLVAPATFATAVAPPAIDTHTHFYDTTRPQGVPWPPKSETLLYRPYLPLEFTQLTAKHNVVGTVVVEASPWVEDNQWILDLARDNEFIVGFIGNLKPGVPEFAAQLKRFAANPIFRGLRFGERVLAEGVGQKAFAADIQRLAERRLTVDVVGSAAMLPHVFQLARQHPQLRFVIDHLPFEAWGNDPQPLRRALAEVTALPNVYGKISNVVRRVNGQVITDVNYYAPQLDALWELFGAERVVYGSNWAVSERVAPYAQVYQLVADYVQKRGQADVAAQYFWRNSLRAYRWQPRGAARALITKGAKR